MAKYTNSNSWGTEPAWDHLPKDSQDPAVQSQWCKSIQWYHHMTDPSQHKEWVLEWMVEHNFTKLKIGAVRRLHKVSLVADELKSLPVGVNTGVLARLDMLGAPLLPKQTEDLKSAIDYLVVKGSKMSEVDPAATLVPSVRENTKEQIRDMIGDLEGAYDTIIRGQTISFTPEEYIKTKGVKPMLARAIAEWFQKYLDEVKCVLDKNCDEQLVEGYAGYSKKNLVTLMNWLNTLIATLSATKSTVVRKKSKRRKSAIDIVKKVSWKKEDTNLGILSVHPSKAVGAERVVLYNSKTKTVSLLEATNADGLDIKGTTFLNYNDKTSFCKIVRNPKPFLEGLKKAGGIRAIKNSLDTLKTTQKSVTGRMNSETLIFIVL